MIKILVAKRTTNNAEKLGLPEEQWGGRKRRSAAELGLENLLTKEYAILSNAPMCLVDLDATTCYDGIIRPIGAVALRSYGLPIHIAHWLISSLKQINYHHVINNQINGQGLSGAGGGW